MSRFIGSLSVFVALCLIGFALASLTLVFGLNFTQARLSDFGVDCHPSTAFLTSVYIASTVGFQVVIGLSFAGLVYFWAKESGPKLVIAISALTVPYAVPSTVGLAMFRFFLADGGFWSTLTGVSPLDGTWSRFAIMIVLGIWQFFPFTFLMVLASFLSVPRRMLDSARGDGAGNLTIFWRILVPLSLPVILAAFTLRTVLMLTKVDAPLAFSLTSPNDFACLASVRIYENMGTFGSMIPMGLIAVLVAAVITALLVGRLLERAAIK